MKIYIKSNKSTKSNDFMWVEDIYTGGNAIIVYGQLSDGSYFYAGDADYSAYILDADPMAENGDDVVSDDMEWILEHSIVDMSELDSYKFWLSLFEYCKNNNIHLYTYDNYNPVIRELKDMIRNMAHV